MRSSLRPATAAAWMLLSLSVMPFAHAAMYKWVDEQGNVQYSQTPPPDASSTRVAPPPPRPTGADQEAQKLQDQLDALQERQTAEKESKEKAEKSQAEAAARAENCERARTALATLQSRGQVRVRDAQGNYTRLDENERQAQIQDAQARIDKYCQ